MSERADFLMALLDFHLSEGLSPQIAWSEALVDYAIVYHADDDRTVLQRAAARALLHAEEDDAAS